MIFFPVRASTPPSSKLFVPRRNPLVNRPNIEPPGVLVACASSGEPAPLALAGGVEGALSAKYRSLDLRPYMVMRQNGRGRSNKLFH